MHCTYSCSSCRRVGSSSRHLHPQSRGVGAPQPLQRVSTTRILTGRRHVALSAASSFVAFFSKDMLLLTCRATLKLAIGCSGIMLLMKSGRIPSTAPQVLSKLAFNVTIPSMLFIKSAETLASSQGDARYLLVPLIAALEVRHSSGRVTVRCLVN